MFMCVCVRFPEKVVWPQVSVGKGSIKSVLNISNLCHSKEQKYVEKSVRYRNCQISTSIIFDILVMILRFLGKKKN